MKPCASVPSTSPSISSRSTKAAASAGNCSPAARATPPRPCPAKTPWPTPTNSPAKRLRQAGYEHYEISNWALPGFRSRHNLKYWRREPYLGFGAGAHSFDGQWRWANAHDPAAYVAAIESGRLPVEQLEEVTPKQALDEELFLGLRQLEGIDLAPIEAQYGAQYEAQYNTIGARIEELRAQGLVERDGSRVRLAPARLAVSNEVFVALLD